MYYGGANTTDLKKKKKKNWPISSNVQKGGGITYLFTGEGCLLL